MPILEHRYPSWTTVIPGLSAPIRRLNVQCKIHLARGMKCEFLDLQPKNYCFFIQNARSQYWPADRSWPTQNVPGWAVGHGWYYGMFGKSFHVWKYGYGLKLQCVYVQVAWYGPVEPRRTLWIVDGGVQTFLEGHWTQLIPKISISPILYINVWAVNKTRTRFPSTVVFTLRFFLFLERKQHYLVVSNHVDDKLVHTF